MRMNHRTLTFTALVAFGLPLWGQSNNNQGQTNTNQYGQNSSNQNNGYDNNQNGNYNGGNYGRSVLPAGTQINVRLDRSGDNSGTRQGDLVQATLVDDLSVNDRLVASSGSRVQLRIDSGSSDRLAYRLDSMTANGQFYRLASDAVNSNDRSNRYNGNNNDNRSGAQKLGDLISGNSNQNVDGQNNQDQRRRDGGQVLSFRLTSAARPQRNR